MVTVVVKTGQKSVTNENTGRYHDVVFGVDVDDLSVAVDKWQR